MSISLKDRVCIITGAGRGIGAGIAQGFTKRGAVVIATDRDTPTLEGVAANMTWDVSDPAAAEAVVADVVKQFGRVDAFVANAGIYPQQPWQDVSQEDWRNVVGVNLDGAWYGAQAVAKPMTAAGYGKIVFVSSVEILIGVAHHAHYSSAKAGLVGLTRSLSRALGPAGVRVNTLMPGAVLTEGELEQFPDQAAAAKLLAERQCLPHRLLPEGIEPTFAFLCAQESDAITGQVLNVDHGLVHY